MAILQDISSPVWTLATLGGGAITEGVSAIRQCIDVIIRTTPGSDPLRPTFGSGVYRYQDKPINIAIPSIKKAIFDSITLWEKRVKLISIKHTLQDNSNIIFFINYKLVDQDLIDSLIITVGTGGVFSNVSGNQLILRGYYPPNPVNYNYAATLILNGQVVLPLLPDSGFATLPDLYNWIKDNWTNYGQWYITPDSIVGFIKPEYSTGSFTISVLSAHVFKGIIPPLQPDYRYNVQITVDGNFYENSSVILSANDVRLWAQMVLNNLGVWDILYAAGDFSADFNDDFDVYQQYLSITTNEATSVEINITTIPV